MNQKDSEQNEVDGVKKGVDSTGSTDACKLRYDTIAEFNVDSKAKYTA